MGCCTFFIIVSHLDLSVRTNGYISARVAAKKEPGVMDRARRERVVQDEVEKANRRPTDQKDTTDTTDRARHPSLLL